MPTEKKAFREKRKKTRSILPLSAVPYNRSTKGRRKKKKKKKKKNLKEEKNHNKKLASLRERDGPGRKKDAFTRHSRAKGELSLPAFEKRSLPVSGEKKKVPGLEFGCVNFEGAHGGNAVSAASWGFLHHGESSLPVGPIQFEVPIFGGIRSGKRNAPMRHTGCHSLFRCKKGMFPAV